MSVDELRQIVERSGGPDRPDNTKWKYFGTDEAYHYLLCEQGSFGPGPDAGRYRTPSATLTINPEHPFYGYTDSFSAGRLIFEGPGRFDNNSFTRFGIQYGATPNVPVGGRTPVTDWSR